MSRQVSVFEVKPFLWDCQDLWSRVLWHPRRPSASYCVELEQYLVHHRYQQRSPASHVDEVGHKTDAFRCRGG